MTITAEVKKGSQLIYKDGKVFLVTVEKL